MVADPVGHDSIYQLEIKFISKNVWNYTEMGTGGDLRSIMNGLRLVQIHFDRNGRSAPIYLECRGEILFNWPIRACGDQVGEPPQNFYTTEFFFTDEPHDERIERHKRAVRELYRHEAM